MKIYYAHCMSIYGTSQEERDIEILESLGFEVANPNTIENQEGMEEYISNGGVGMSYFTERLIIQCDALAFRGLPDGSIPGGIAKELIAARQLEMPVIELPNFSLRKYLSKGETREYLKEVGQR